VYQRGSDDLCQDSTCISPDDQQEGLGLVARHPIGGNMSSTSQSVPLTRRSQGGLAIAIAVLVAIAVAVTLIAVTGPSNPTPRPSAAAVGNTASSQTVQPNPDQQGTSQLAITSQLEQQRGNALPGWLLR
jgi:hypothetical protein